MRMISHAREVQSSSSFLLSDNLPFRNADELPHRGGSEDEDTTCRIRHLSPTPTTPPFILLSHLVSLSNTIQGFSAKNFHHLFSYTFFCRLLSSATLFPCLSFPLGDRATSQLVSNSGIPVDRSRTSTNVSRVSCDSQPLQVRNHLLHSVKLKGKKKSAGFCSFLIYVTYLEHGDTDTGGQNRGT